MSDSKDGAGAPNKPKSREKPTSDAAKARLAEALRANLQRRKSQERARDSGSADKKRQSP